MTLPEFLEKLRETPRNWIVYDDRRIRLETDATTSCPLTCFSGENSVMFSECAQKLGISEPDMYSIVEAADAMTRHDPKIRAQLLEACGLK